MKDYMTSVSFLNKKKSVLYYPIIVIVIYLIGTICLYTWGPYAWVTYEPVYFYMLLLLYLVALILGYFCAVNLNTKTNFKYSEQSISKIKKSLPIIYILTLIYLFVVMTRDLGLYKFSLMDLINAAKKAIENPALQYSISFSEGFYKGAGGKIITVVILLLSPVAFVSTSLTVIFIKQLSIRMKTFGISVIILQIARWTIIGKNKGIFDIVISISCIIVIRFLQERFKFKGKGKTAKIIMLISILFLFAILSFGKVIDARLGSGWKYYMIGGIGIDFASPLLNICPFEFQGLLVYLTSYLTQGYYAISLALKMQWIPMFGLGSSMFLMNYIMKYFTVDIAQYSYQQRLVEYGWMPELNWHTFYLWIANDTGLVGVSFVLFFVGFLLAIVYKDAIVNNNPFAIILFILMVTMCLYLPANNQIFSFIESFITFWLILFCWIMTKVKLKGYS